MTDFDPTERQLAAARRRLEGLDDADALATTLGVIGGNLESAGLVDPADVIRESRAALVAYHERRRGVA